MSFYGRHKEVLFKIEKAQVKFDLMSTGLHKLWKHAIPAIPDHSLYDSKHPICEPGTQYTLFYGFHGNGWKKKHKKTRLENRTWIVSSKSKSVKRFLEAWIREVVKCYSANCFHWHPLPLPPFPKKLLPKKLWGILVYQPPVNEKYPNFALKNFA